MEVKLAKESVISGKHLDELRKSTKMRQKQFAELVDIPVDTIRSWEQGRRMLTAGKFREIKSKLGYVESSRNGVRVMIDYLRITFKDVRDLDWFCQEYLYCSKQDFVSVEKKLMNYTHLWQRGDIWIFDYADKTQTENYQLTLQLSGSGCRQFELLLERANTNWGLALQKMMFERKDMNVTRIDIAMDEMYKGFGHEKEQFHLSDMISKCYKDEVILDRMKKYNHIGGGSLGDDESSDGISIYFGSRQSALFFNFYEKRFELAKKENISVVEALEVFGIWNRYELRFSDEKAHSLVDEFVNGVDIAELAKGVLNKEIQVYDGTNEYGAFLPDKKWQAMFGGVAPLKLSTSPEHYDIMRTVKWLIYQVSDSLRMVIEADKKMATEYLKIIMDAGELNERGQKVVEQLSVEDRIALDEILGISA